MYSYDWDPSTGGYILNSTPLNFSKEPRPVYYKELDMLGFDRYWDYEKDDTYPYMWAEANTYWYRGRKVAQTKGGSCYEAPEIIINDEAEPAGQKLRFVDIPTMVKKNELIMEGLVQETIKKVYNTYIEYFGKVDVFYVAFSGGKDSVVALDIVQRALPHNAFKVLFGDTGMEFPDTYDCVNRISEYCKDHEIEFLRAKSELTPDQTWGCFGPPAVTNRWCCSVHKTSPQVRLLQSVTGISNFTGMAFTGVRGDESIARSEYEDVSLGGKHQGQYSCHPIIEWNSAELFNYIYANDLVLNEAYKKGNTRAGCLVCPMSSGKHEYIKRQWYTSEVDHLLDKIISTSGKVSYNQQELREFVDAGFWRTRKTGRELNFGQDKHIVENAGGRISITVFSLNDRWKEWAKTIGTVIEKSPNEYVIDYMDGAYTVKLESVKEGTIFTFPDCGTGKNDIKFLSLFRSVIIKSIYCVNCGVCVAECKHGCIDMKHGLKISDNCVHCHSCHDIHEHCLRYNSIRNKIGGERMVKGLGKYFSFGVKGNWVRTYFKYKGSEQFWDSDGEGEVANKKKDAFLNFVKDAGFIAPNRTVGHDKYTKFDITDFGKVVFSLGFDSEAAWGLMLSNLVYAPDFNWYVKNIPENSVVTPDQMKMLLEPFMENDAKGLGKRNVVDAFKIILITTPLGSTLGLGNCDYVKKITSTGNETYTLNSLTRTAWEYPEPLVILYSLYKFAEACDGYYQFTLTRLLNHDIDSDGVSPTEIFGIDRDKMEKILNGLSVNYPEFINCSFTIDLDNISLRSDKTSADVLSLF